MEMNTTKRNCSRHTVDIQDSVFFVHVIQSSSLQFRVAIIILNRNHHVNLGHTQMAKNSFSQLFSLI